MLRTLLVLSVVSALPAQTCALDWSTYFRGAKVRYAMTNVLCVHAGPDGTVTVAGRTDDKNFPTTPGAYDRTLSAGGWSDIFVARFDLRRLGTAQLVYSTFVGGTADDDPTDLHVDKNGVITVCGSSRQNVGNNDFPTTTNAYDRTFNGGPNLLRHDAVLFRLDPRKSGAAQLVYSTYFGGAGSDRARGMHVDANGVVTFTGYTQSKDLPVTANAYDSKLADWHDGFLARLDPRKTGAAQLTYSTYFGGDHEDFAEDVAIGPGGFVGIVGRTRSLNFPVSSQAFQKNHQGGAPIHDYDGFVCGFDLTKTGSAQLLYSTYVGGKAGDYPKAITVDERGRATIVGDTLSIQFPTTANAFSRRAYGRDVFVATLDPIQPPASQLVFGTLFGGRWEEAAAAIVRGADGVFTITGHSNSADLAVTKDAFQPKKSGTVIDYDGFVARLDPRRSGKAQLSYSTFLGGNRYEQPADLAVDASGTAIVVGSTQSSDYHVSSTAYQRTSSGNTIGFDGCMTRLAMNASVFADTHELSHRRAGHQKLRICAGTANANQSYRVVGTLAGTSPGLNWGGVNIPINPDWYTDLTIYAPTAPTFVGFAGKLDAAGAGRAGFLVPSGLPPLLDFTIHHAVIVLDANGLRWVSNAVPLRLRN